MRRTEISDTKKWPDQLCSKKNKNQTIKTRYTPAKNIVSSVYTYILLLQISEFLKITEHLLSLVLLA